MKRKSKLRSGLIDLGSAKVETRGAIGPNEDEVLRQDKPGLSTE